MLLHNWLPASCGREHLPLPLPFGPQSGPLVRCSSPEYTPTKIYPGIIWARTEYTPGMKWASPEYTPPAQIIPHGGIIWARTEYTRVYSGPGQIIPGIFEDRGIFWAVTPAFPHMMYCPYMDRNYGYTPAFYGLPTTWCMEELSARIIVLLQTCN